MQSRMIAQHISNVILTFNKGGKRTIGRKEYHALYCAEEVTMQTLWQIAQFFEGAGTWLAVSALMGVIGYGMIIEAIIHKLKGMYKARRTRRKRGR